MWCLIPQQVLRDCPHGPRGPRAEQQAEAALHPPCSWPQHQQEALWSAVASVTSGGCPGEASPGDRTSGMRRAGVHRTSGVGTLDEEAGAVAGGRLPGGGPQTAGGRDFRQGNHELADIPFSHSTNVLGAPLCAGHHLREQGTLREQDKSCSREPMLQ